MSTTKRFNQQPLGPDPAPYDVVDPDDDEAASPSALVAESEIYAHQSLIGSDVLNIEVDAPRGVTVRLHVNDERIIEVGVG